MKRSGPIRRYTPVRKRRAKPRRGRLKGEELVVLRSQCFGRDLYRCVVCSGGITWDTGHMAHIGAKRRHGDSLANVRTLCAECHRKEHNWGKSMKKPVPKKPGMEAA